MNVTVITREYYYYYYLVYAYYYTGIRSTTPFVQTTTQRGDTIYDTNYYRKCSWLNCIHTCIPAFLAPSVFHLSCHAYVFALWQLTSHLLGSGDGITDHPQSTTRSPYYYYYYKTWTLQHTTSKPNTCGEWCASKADTSWQRKCSWPDCAACSQCNVSHYLPLAFMYTYEYFLHLFFSPPKPH